uniref:p55 n=2 Tax=unclassified Closteroviridae TaxID=217429 RepID=A0A7U3VDC7_9CLOS|nr:p55 [Closteroviridae sp.]UVT34986.1 p55 [peony leafroll-associated virus]UXV25354.1 p55 [peony leafroll-associated virus]
MDGLTWLLGTTKHEPYLSEAREVISSAGGVLVASKYTVGLSGSDIITKTGYGRLSGEESVMIGVFIALGGPYNVVMGDEEAYNLILNYHSRKGEREPWVNKKLDEVVDAYSDLTPRVTRVARSLSFVVNEAWLRVAKAVSQFLNRELSEADFVGAGTIPVVRVSTEKKEKPEVTDVFPRFFTSFVDEYAEVVDASSSESFIVSLGSLKEHVDIVKMVVNFGEAKPNLQAFTAWIGLLLMRYRPSSLLFESRIVWYNKVSADLKRIIEKYYNKTAEIRRDEIITATPILKGDRIHELTKYMVTILKETYLPRSDEMCIEKVIGTAVNATLDTNKDVLYTFTDTLCVILIYLSIYGTSPLRISPPQSNLSVTINGKRINVNFSGFLRCMSRLTSETGGKLNLMRLFARKCSSLTYLLRSKGGIKQEFWTDVILRDTVMSFDTANTIQLKYVPKGSLRDFEEIRKKIERSGPSRGQTLDRIVPCR